MFSLQVVSHQDGLAKYFNQTSVHSFEIASMHPFVSSDLYCCRLQQRKAHASSLNSLPLFLEAFLLTELTTVITWATGVKIGP